MAYDHGRQRYYHALGAKEQHFADEIVTLIQATCAYLHAAESEYEPLEGVPESASPTTRSQRASNS